MPDRVFSPLDAKGLTTEEVEAQLRLYGKNIYYAEQTTRFGHILWSVVKEPMFILLLLACAIYFVLKQYTEGVMMLVAMGIVTTISIYQEFKSSKALQSLKEFTEPRIPVMRDGEQIVIAREVLVPGDVMLLSEGMKIPADAVILTQNDFTVNESIITGESLPVEKENTQDANTLWQGTIVNSGKCMAQVTATGLHTALAKLGKAVSDYQPHTSILQRQINIFVRRLALFGFIGFAIILVLNYVEYRDWITSLLFALTLAMSVIPEEIPVAFSSFMALGAYKLSRVGIISRHAQIIESLGTVTVICLDKTGTITENRMDVRVVYDLKKDYVADILKQPESANEDVLRYAVLASEKEPFDEMEKAIWRLYAEVCEDNATLPAMIHEYPLMGKPPMMTHVYREDQRFVAAAKGGVETIARVCKLDTHSAEQVYAQVRIFASQGYRVIAVASAIWNIPEFPANQENFNWRFEGLLALYDPPKPNVAGAIKSFYSANIDVKLISGDYAETSLNIARQVGIKVTETVTTGDDILKMDEEELSQTVRGGTVFARMFPDAKVRVIKALRSSGEVVAMTGDGVNDGPALKSADIGIAMGKRGTGIARQAADIILTDDDLDKMVTAIMEGRKIYNNLKKAIHYIIAIHVPIILVASVPVVAGWKFPNIFTPIHIIFFELIMGPTCSIFFEREPVEGNIMHQQPRSKTSNIFSKRELFVAIAQGVVIATGALALYFYFMQSGEAIEQTRTIVLMMLLISNVFLTFTNRSFTESILITSRYKNSLAPVVLIISILFILALVFIPAFQDIFLIRRISFGQFSLAFGLAFISVCWFELYKFFVKRNRLHDQ